jgi:hypothetical protein
MKYPRRLAALSKHSGHSAPPLAPLTSIHSALSLHHQTSGCVRPQRLQYSISRLPRPTLQSKSLNNRRNILASCIGKLDLQDWLIISGVFSGEGAAAVIWWPAALILACLFSFGFAYLIEKSKKTVKLAPSRLGEKPS